MTYQTVNPYTNETVVTYPFATDAELESAIAQGHELYERFKTQPIAERGVLLHKVAAKLREHADELARICTVDMGKLVGESAGEVELCAIIADWFADHSEDLLKPEAIETIATGEAEVRHLSLIHI